MYYVPCLTEREESAARMTNSILSLRREGIFLCQGGLPTSYNRKTGINIDDDTVTQFHMATLWLRSCKKSKSYNKLHSSYGYKNQVKYGSRFYISNGVMILAMLSSGFADMAEIKRGISMNCSTIRGRISSTSLRHYNKLCISSDDRSSLILLNYSEGWSPTIHRYYSFQFKNMVKSIFATGITSNSSFTLLPNEIIFSIIRCIS